MGRLVPLLIAAILLVPALAQAQGSGGTFPSTSIPTLIAQLVQFTTIGPDGTFYYAQARVLPRATTSIPSILPQQTIVRAIGVHDTRDPRWQTTVDGTPGGLEVGDRDVYLATVSLPTVLMGGPSAGGTTNIPVFGPAKLNLLNAATGAVVRTVNLSGSAVRSLDVKKIQNTEYVYVITTSPVAILTATITPATPVLEIFDADGNRIKQVPLTVD